MVLGLPDQLQIFSDRIATAFNRSGATWAVALNISKAFDRIWHASLLHKLKSYGISGQIFGLISSFLSSRQLWVVLDGSLHKNIQLMLEFLKALFLVLYFFYYTLVTFLMMLSVILLYMLMRLLFILSVIRHQNCSVAPRSAQSFILPRSIKWEPEISGNLVVKSKLQQSKLWLVIGHDWPDFQFDRKIFPWNSQKWPITEWDHLDSEVWQTACVWHGRWNEKKKVC